MYRFAILLIMVMGLVLASVMAQRVSLRAQTPLPTAEEIAEAQEAHLEDLSAQWRAALTPHPEGVAGDAARRQEPAFGILVPARVEEAEFRRASADDLLARQPEQVAESLVGMRMDQVGVFDESGHRDHLEDRAFVERRQHHGPMRPGRSPSDMYRIHQAAPRVPREPPKAAP